MSLDITKSMKIIGEPETVIDGTRANTVIQLEVPRNAYQKLMEYNETVGSKLEALIRSFSEEKKLFVTINEDNRVELRTSDGSRIADTGYDKTALTVALNNHIQEQTGKSLVEYVREVSEQAFIESANAIRGSLEVFRAAVRDNDIIYGAYVKDREVYDMLASRISPKLNPEIKPEDVALVFITDKLGKLDPRDGAYFFTDVPEVDAQYKTYTAEGVKYQTQILVPLSKVEAVELGRELSLKLDRYVENADLLHALKEQQKTETKEKTAQEPEKTAKTVERS